MLADLSRLVRLGLVFGLATVIVAQPSKTPSAYAQDEEDEEDDDGGGDDDDGGGDDEEGGGDDEDGEDEEEEEGQPPVTAGGLFTKKTWPISEIERPLTVIKGMTEVRVLLGSDISAKQAFEKWRAGVDGRYGVQDNVELQFGFISDLNKFTSLSLSAGLEIGVVYDLVDLRLAAVLPVNKVETTTGTPPNTMTSSSTDVLLDFELGFPFRYKVQDKMALIALDTFMTINTKGKPDLTPAVGVIFQAAPPLAIIVKAKMIIRDFDTDGDNFQVPATAAIQFSPKSTFDVGGEFTFNNLKVKDPAKFYDSRTLLFFAQFRL